MELKIIELVIPLHFLNPHLSFVFIYVSFGHLFLPPFHSQVGFYGLQYLLLSSKLIQYMNDLYFDLIVFKYISLFFRCKEYQIRKLPIEDNFDEITQYK